MHINKIKLYNYRNYENIEIEFDKNINIIIGKNAQGKTNLIEAIYVTSMGKSFRTSKDNELIKFNSEFCKINSEYIKYEEDGNVEVAISKDKKAIKVDGVNIKKISQLMENVLTVVFSPEDLKIVKEEPQKRRNFIDRELCQLKISYFSNLGNYKKILLQRNSYLKEKNTDENILEVLDDQLADYGSKIIIERNQFVKNLNEISKNIHKKITNKREEIDIKYLSDIPIEDNISIIKENFINILKKNRNNDLYKKTTTRGPHRDDLKIIINKNDARKFGSQGQQRTAALSMKLAEIELIKKEKKETPILLLDDVMSELDSERQKFLINYLEDVQIFITTTELNKEVEESFLRSKIIKIKKGELDIKI